VTGIKRHILVVDDTEDNRTLLEHFLQTSGFETQTAAGGEEALELIAEDPPAAILLDMMMPVVSGIDVVRRLRGEERFAGLPVIMVTARSESRDIVEALRAGASDYVTKPIDFNVLMARLDTHLRLARLQQEAAEMSERLLAEIQAARAVQETLLPGEKTLASLPDSYGLRLRGPPW